jgi:hypothetical protein
MLEKYLFEKEKELMKLKNDASNNNRKVNKEAEKEFI